MRNLFLAIIVLAAGTSAVIAALSSFGASNSIEAQEVLDRAINSDIRPKAGETLHLITRQYSRAEPKGMRLQDPYHFDLYEAEPETVIVDAWFRADQSGVIARRYALATNENGVIVQEAARESARVEHVYQPTRNALDTISIEPDREQALQSISIPQRRPNSDVSVAGMGKTANRSTTIIRVETGIGPVPSSDNIYERPYTRDLQASRGVERIEVADDTGDVLRYSVDFVTEAGEVVRVIDTEVLTLEIVPTPADEFFTLKHADADSRATSQEWRAPDPVVYTDPAQVPPAVAVGVVQTAARVAAGLSLQSVHGADQLNEPLAGEGDVRMASTYGLSLTTTYIGASLGEGETPVALRVTVGESEPLVRLLRSSVAWWSGSEPLKIVLADEPLDAWLMTRDGQHMVIAESGGMLILWEAQGLSVPELVRLIGATEF